MGIRAFIFDFDGTIGDSSECGLRATQETFAESGYGIPSRDQIEYYMGIPIEQSFKLMLPHEISGTDFNALLTFFREKYATYEDEYLSSFAHVADTLRQLKARGSQLFVLSSKKTDVLHWNVATLGLIDLFTEIVGSDKVTAYKPDPVGILYLMHKYQLNPQQTIMIGDATFDIQMGNRAQVQTCAVTWGAHSLDLLQAERPTFIVNYATEWLRLI
ncbi:HAD family hydrolase [Aerococcaceae bacterium NML191292]|nr:HAD family hydrolase [Aerococcaceae bacterium NML191292]MCW6661466.1 HAD family hydrolase [Aerococcaceae bacterium NML201209]MCW6665236.1 HAD family hydrolase [Aerococcaceae bacterium NML191219]MCW6680613.1 HAD family hydrolase [Aerococcaceae bacterium NML130460]